MRAFGGAAIWLVAVVLIALGAAGLVGAFDGPRVGDTDPALTAAGDARLTLLLDDAEADLAAVAADVDALSRAARRALGSLSGSDLASVATAVAEGDELILGIRAGTAVLAAELRSMPIVGTPTADVELSAPVRTRHARLTDGVSRTACPRHPRRDGRTRTPCWHGCASNALEAPAVPASFAIETPVEPTRFPPRVLT